VRRVGGTHSRVRIHSYPFELLLLHFVAALSSQMYHRPVASVAGPAAAAGGAAGVAPASSSSAAAAAAAAAASSPNSFEAPVICGLQWESQPGACYRFVRGSVRLPSCAHPVACEFRSALPTSSGGTGVGQSQPHASSSSGSGSGGGGCSGCGGCGCGEGGSQALRLSAEAGSCILVPVAGALQMDAHTFYMPLRDDNTSASAAAAMTTGLATARMCVFQTGEQAQSVILRAQTQWQRRFE
jgi:hypothetical protein